MEGLSFFCYLCGFFIDSVSPSMFRKPVQPYPYGCVLGGDGCLPVGLFYRQAGQVIVMFAFL